MGFSLMYGFFAKNVVNVAERRTMKPRFKTNRQKKALSGPGFGVLVMSDAGMGIKE